MDKIAFEEIRHAPTGRASVFIPELLLVRSLKTAPEEKKIVIRLMNDTFRDAATKLFIGTLDPQSLDLMLTDISMIRHPEDYDPNILMVAAYFKLRYPRGLNTSNIASADTLGPDQTRDLLFNNFVNTIYDISVDKKTISANNTKKVDIIAAIKADIITYYYMLMNP
jgi:hypothetical protein